MSYTMLRLPVTVFGMVWVLLSANVLADPISDCLVRELNNATDNTSVGQIRQLCRDETTTATNNELSGEQTAETALERRRDVERRTEDEPFVLTPHRPNYILPVTYNSKPNGDPFNVEDDVIDNVEAKFQISLKLAIWNNIFGDNGYLYGAYTNQSWWQAYNSEISAPFRETNHEPELYLAFDTRWHLAGFDINEVSLGVNHQSNGQSGSKSRSWNRIFAQVSAEKNRFFVSLKPWYRIPEETKDDPKQPDGDDNPDILDYMGHGELHMLYRASKHHIGMTLRNNLKSNNKGSVQLDWTFPIGKRTRGYVQYFNGYGESLIDYDHYTNRIGIGIMLTDWL
ncbi:MAG: phospholipase A [Pseudomonadales bacterium]